MPFYLIMDYLINVSKKSINRNILGIFYFVTSTLALVLIIIFLSKCEENTNEYLSKGLFQLREIMSD